MSKEAGIDQDKQKGAPEGAPATIQPLAGAQPSASAEVAAAMQSITVTQSESSTKSETTNQLATAQHPQVDAASQPESPPSVRDLAPLESGGPTARSGFAYQDHVAVGFCIDMLDAHEITEVWCELLDDITLIRDGAGEELVEFVQVKSHALDQLWSVALLCERKKAKAGTSILERSLAHDRCSQRCQFRLVTLLGINDELRLLSLALHAPERAPTTDEFKTLAASIAEKLADVPRNGPKSLSDWILRTTWEVRGDEGAIRNANWHRLHEFAFEAFAISAPDQVQILYELLLTRVFNAANERNPTEKKKLLYQQLMSDLQIKVAALKSPRSYGRNLRTSLEALGLPPNEVDQAVLLLRRYKGRRRTPSYQILDNQQDHAEAIEALLRTLRAEYASGLIQATSAQFHAKCLQALLDYHKGLANPQPPLSDLQAMMYLMVERGLHWFEQGN